MNFLAPLFLAGAAAVAIPVVLHLIRRSTRDRIPFSSLLLLQPTPPRMRRRSRLEDLLLLLLRCAIVALAALAFGRPFLKDPALQPPASTATQRVVVLLDTSASMQRPGLWKAAVERSLATLRTLAPADQASILAFDRETRPLVTFDSWNATPAGSRIALAEAALRDARPGWAATHLANALIQAAESLTERSDDPASLLRRVVLLSDLQEGSRLDALQAYDWPKGVTVSVDRLDPDARSGNASVQLLPDPTPNPGATSQVVRVRVQTTADLARTDRLELGWLGPGSDSAFAAPPEELRLAAGANRVVALTVPASRPERIQLRGDAESFDNTLFLVPPAPVHRGILCLTADDPADPRLPLYFLQRAFPATNAAAGSLLVRKPDAPPAAGDAPVALLIATDALPENAARALRAAALAGATVLFSPRSANAANAATLGLLLDLPPPTLSEVRPPNYAMLGELDFRHPLLAPFANPKFSDFTKVHFWKYRRLDTQTVAAASARVVARFDDGDPAWIEAPAGRGRIVVLASGWHPDDSQLALSSKFVPLLVSLLEGDSGGAGTTTTALRAQTVGDLLPLPQPLPAGARLRLPDGTETALAPGATNHPADRPGLYALVLPGGTNASPSGPGSGPVRYAVNLDPSESRTIPLALEELERHGVALKDAPAGDTKPSADRAAELAAAEIEGRQKLWRWFLLAAVAIVFLESILAGWITHRSATPDSPPAPSAPPNQAAA